MTAEERLDRVRKAVAPVLSWYRSVLVDGGPDFDPWDCDGMDDEEVETYRRERAADYLYDETWRAFEDKLSRGDFQAIVEALL